MKRFIIGLIVSVLLTGCSLPDIGQKGSNEKQIQIKHEPSYIQSVEEEEQDEDPVYTNQ